MPEQTQLDLQQKLSSILTWVEENAKSAEAFAININDFDFLENYHIWNVVFEEGAFIFEKKWQQGVSLREDYGEMIVVGNIFENSDLK